MRSNKLTLAHTRASESDASERIGYIPACLLLGGNALTTPLLRTSSNGRATALSPRTRTWPALSRGHP